MVSAVRASCCAEMYADVRACSLCVVEAMKELLEKL